MQKTNYEFRSAEEPHKLRRKEILTRYPQVRKLMGNCAWSGFFVIAIGVFQVWMARYVSLNFSIGTFLLAAFCLGAVASHALFVLIHEATHNLIFKSTLANRWIAMAANLTQGIPSAMAFRNYHLIHHKHQGLLALDADLPGPIEAKFIGNNPVSKTFWLFCFLLVQGFVRPARLKSIKLWNAWTITNLTLQLAFNALIVIQFGWAALAYLLVSTWFGVGLHPLGARWVQEHFVFRAGQETYSYYGPLNKLMFNVGYHNEHHDLMTIPWTRLPALKAAAPDYYDSLYSHTSYLKLLYRFIFDSTVSAHSRVVQVTDAELKSAAALSKSNAVDTEEPSEIDELVASVVRS